MSWYIQQLLKSSIEIRTKADIESDEYNDLVVVEKKISDLHKDGIMSDKEISLVRYISDGKPLVNSKSDFGKNRISVSKDINDLCNKVAFYLGGYFTNDGYINYMRTKYKLTDGEIENMVNYMNSKYKHKLIRKTKVNE